MYLPTYQEAVKTPPPMECANNPFYNLTILN